MSCGRTAGFRREGGVARGFATLIEFVFAPPAIALVLAAISLLTMVYYNQFLTRISVGLLGQAFGYFELTKHHRATAIDRH